MKLKHHTAISITISGILYMIFKSWGLALTSLAAGIFIDLDHIIDVAREHGWSVKIKDFFVLCENGQFDRIILVLHGWEWIILMSAASWLTNWNPWITGTAIGLGQHLLLDTYYNGAPIPSYSLIYRWKKNFDFDTIFPKFIHNKYKYKDYISNQLSQ